MVKVPLLNPKPDIKNFCDVIKGNVIPKKPPLVELFLDYEIVEEISTKYLGRRWVKPEQDKESIKAYLKN